MGVKRQRPPTAECHRAMTAFTGSLSSRTGRVCIQLWVSKSHRLNASRRQIARANLINRIQTNCLETQISIISKTCPNLWKSSASPFWQSQSHRLRFPSSLGDRFFLTLLGSPLITSVYEGKRSEDPACPSLAFSMVAKLDKSSFPLVKGLSCAGMVCWNALPTLLLRSPTSQTYSRIAFLNGFLQGSVSKFFYVGRRSPVSGMSM